MASDGASFVFTSTCPRVVFGVGKINALPEELQHLKVGHPMIVCSPTRTSLAVTVQCILTKASVPVAGILDKAVVHVPVHITEDAAVYTKSQGADSVISVGGGSAVGLAKAICYRTGLPHICIPTTYSGSEMTAILGELKDGKKVAITNPKILPSVVIYDVDLTVQLPKALTAVSGLNALAHSIEALYAERANPVMSTLALESITLLRKSLPAVMADPLSIRERSSVLQGAFLAGMTVAATGIALQHKLAHTVAGCCNLPHADTHAILLPHTISYNIGALDDSTVERLGLVLTGRPQTSPSDIVAALGTLLRTLGVRCALKDVGMSESDVDRTADIAMQKPYWNPRPLERAKIREIIRRAWAGEMPKADL